MPSLARTTVFELHKLLQIEFKGVSDVFTAVDIADDKEIKRVPLWLSAIDAFVGKIGERSLEFATSHTKMRHITFVDENDHAYLSIVCFGNRATINSRFHLNNMEIISFNRNSTNAINERVVCKIRTHGASGVFKVRITWFGHKHVFEIHPLIGPILVDPMKPLERNQNSATFNVRINVFEDDRRREAEAPAMALNDRIFTFRLNLSDFENSAFGLEQEFRRLLRNTRAIDQ